MAKRYLETEIWKKSWWRKLHPKLKLFYYYMISNCNHAGVWADVDLELASFQIGMPIDEKEILKQLKDHIEIIKPNKWFVKKFPSFQYGTLNPNVRAHASVIKILEENNLTCNKVLANPLERVKDKDKYKDKSKVKDKEKDMNPSILKVSEKQKKTLGYRRTQFCNKVNLFADKYDKGMRIDFIDYWTESGGSKMRFEKEKVFEVVRRLIRWSKNDFNKKDETGKFKLDSTGNSFIGYCSKCRVSDFFNKWELQNMDSRCCKVKIIPIREEK